MEGFEVRPPRDVTPTVTSEERRAEHARASHILGLKQTVAGKTLISWMNGVAKSKELALLTEADPNDTAKLAEAFGEIRELRWWIAQLEASPKQQTEEVADG